MKTTRPKVNAQRGIDQCLYSTIPLESVCTVCACFCCPHVCGPSFQTEEKVRSIACPRNDSNKHLPDSKHKWPLTQPTDWAIGVKSDKVDMNRRDSTTPTDMNRTPPFRFSPKSHENNISPSGHMGGKISPSAWCCGPETISALPSCTQCNLGEINNGALLRPSM